MAKTDSLPKFAGGSDAVAHASKPGSSLKIKVSQLVDALGHILTTGDVSIRLTTVYTDALPCNGATYNSAEYPELAAKLNSGDKFTVPNIRSNASNISYYIKT